MQRTATKHPAKSTGTPCEPGDFFMHRIEEGSASRAPDETSFGDYGTGSQRRTSVSVDDTAGIIDLSTSDRNRGTISALIANYLTADEAQRLACALLNASAHLRRRTRAMAKAAGIAALTVTLTACGGGSPDDEHAAEPRSQIPPITCTTPECTR